MFVGYHCPSCQQFNSNEVVAQKPPRCTHCDWEPSLREEQLAQDPPEKCLICGCTDLWRQKDFPQALGLAFVVAGASLSTIAYYYYMPITALAVLMGFALLDMILYVAMPDVLVCYRCAARYRQANLQAESSGFNLEIAERYRQEEIRLKQAQASSPREN